MRVAIVGSRDYPRLHRVSDFVLSIARLSHVVDGHVQATTVVSGGAAGVDEQAARAARAFGLKVDEIRVDTVGLPEDEEARRIEYGKRAYARNTRIVESADLVVAFWTQCARPRCPRPQPHRTHGTDHAIREAERLGKKLRTFGPNGLEDR